MRVQRPEVLAHARQVELLAPLLDDLADRHADAAPLVAEQGEQADRRTAQVLRGIAEGGHVDRGEEHRQADDQHHPRPDHVPGADLQVHPRHPVVPGRHDQQAPGDQPAGVGAPADEDPDDEHHQDGEDAGGRHHQPGDEGVVAEQGLEQGRQDHAGAVEDAVGTEDDDAAGREVALAHRPEVDHRVGDPQLPEDQGSQPQHEKDEQRLELPEGVVVPVPLLPLAEHNLPATHRQGEQPQTDVVEVERPATQLRPLLLEVFGVLDREVAHQVAEDADREVDEEDPAPVVVDGDVAAQRRADDRGDQPRHAEHRHGRALLLGREAVDQDPLAGGLESAAGDALDHPEEDQLLETGGKAAQHRGGGEDGDGEEEVPAAAQAGREPASDRQDGGVGRQVAGHDPVAVVHRRRQAAGDVAHRGRGDRGVQDLHERGDDHGRCDEPGVDRRTADRTRCKGHAAHDAYS